MTLNPEKLQADLDRLRSAVRMAIDSFEVLVDPDPNKGILTNVKLQGEQQGVPLNDTFDAVNEVIAVLRHDLAATEAVMDVVLHIDQVPIERHWAIAMQLHDLLGHSEPWEICTEGCDALANEAILTAFGGAWALPNSKPHSHEWSDWQDDPAGVVRSCACGAVQSRPEG